MHIENQSKSNHITLEELLKEKHKFGFNDLVSFRKGKKKERIMQPTLIKPWIARLEKYNSEPTWQHRVLGSN